MSHTIFIIISSIVPLIQNFWILFRTKVSFQEFFFLLYSISRQSEPVLFKASFLWLSCKFRCLMNTEALKMWRSIINDNSRIHWTVDSVQRTFVKLRNTCKNAVEHCIRWFLLEIWDWSKFDISKFLSILVKIVVV